MTLLLDVEGAGTYAIKISETEAKELNWSSQVLLRHSIVDGKLVIEVAPIPTYSLEELVAQITPENRHSETEWGLSVGNEF